MPFYDYQAKAEELGCEECSVPFEVFQHMSDEKLKTCPKCGGEIIRLVSGKPMISTGGWPMKSAALGVNPRQIREAGMRLAAAGIPTQFDAQGDAILENPQHRKKVCEHLGFFDKSGGGGRYDPKLPAPLPSEDT